MGHAAPKLPHWDCSHPPDGGRRDTSSGRAWAWAVFLASHSPDFSPGIPTIFWWGVFTHDERTKFIQWNLRKLGEEPKKSFPTWFLVLKHLSGILTMVWYPDNRWEYLNISHSVRWNLFLRSVCHNFDRKTHFHSLLFPVQSDYLFHKNYSE